MSDIKALAIVPTETELTAINNIAVSAVQSGLFGRDMTYPKAFIIMLKGRELGIPILQAVSQIHIIEGKPCMSAELMHSQVLKHLPHASIHFVEVNNTACKIEAKRSKNDPTSTFTFTIADAKAAGLLSKSNWQKYPRAMLRSRCISEVCRSVFPDALHGVSYTPEEMGTEGNEEIKNITPIVQPERTPVETIVEPIEVPEGEAPRLASTMTDEELKKAIWPTMKLLNIGAEHGLKIVAEIKKADIAMNDLGAVKSTLATLKRIVEEQK